MPEEEMSFAMAEESSTEDMFQIDTRAEKKYNAKRAAEELRELEEKYADESISITEEESSYVDDPQENEEIKKIIEDIRNKEPKIYDKSARFYGVSEGVSEEARVSEESNESKESNSKTESNDPNEPKESNSSKTESNDPNAPNDLNESKESNSKTESKEPNNLANPNPNPTPTPKNHSYTLKDYYRDQILEKMGTTKKKRKIQYDEEQKENVDEFISELIKEEPQESIFTKKEKTQPEEQEIELEPEIFLQKYVLGGGWKQEATKKDEEFLDEDSEELEIIEEFDKEGQESMPKLGQNGESISKTVPNEESISKIVPNEESISKIVPSICPTTKKPVQSRKRKELKNKLRHREKEKQRQEEIKRLKNLKKQQFQERIKLLKQVSSLSNRKLAKINLKDEYTEQAFNKMLDSLFNAQYDQKEEKHRPKLTGASVEAQELQEIETLAEEGEMQKDRKREKEVRKILQQIKELRNDYNSLQTSGSFKYVTLPSVKIGLSALDILSMDERDLKRNYPLKKLAPFQDPEEKRKLQNSLGKTREEKTKKEKTNK